MDDFRECADQPGRAGIDRRAALTGLAAALVAAGLPPQAQAASWDLVVQILAGARMKDPTVLALALDSLRREFGEPALRRLAEAVLARDAANIVEPFTDPQTEAAARRFVEMLYSGEIADGAGKPLMLGFHQSLAWQVLPFTKAPSLCGPGFGWWNAPPDVS
jgi:hypothetical protein